MSDRYPTPMQKSWLPDVVRVKNPIKRSATGKIEAYDDPVEVGGKVEIVNYELIDEGGRAIRIGARIHVPAVVGVGVGSIIEHKGETYTVYSERSKSDHTGLRHVNIFDCSKRRSD